MSEPTNAAKLIVVEGLSGSGKSTVSGRLAEAAGLLRIEALRGPFQPAIASMSDDPNAVDARYATYLASMFRTAEAVRAALAGGRSCVCDSWLFRTHFTHKVLGATMEVRDPAWIPAPDHTFWLEVDPLLRKERIASRGASVDHWKRTLESHSEELKALYLAGVAGLVELDGSQPVDDIVAEILDQLSLHDDPRLIAR